MQCIREKKNTDKKNENVIRHVSLGERFLAAVTFY